MSASILKPSFHTVAQSRVSFLALAMLSAAALPACGGDPAANTPDGSTAATCGNGNEPDVSDPTTLLDDFEDGNAQIAPVAGRMGGWYSFGDTTVGGTIQPLGDSAPEVIPGGRATSKRALHMTSTGFLDWGSGVSTAVHWGPNAAGVSGLLPYDARDYKGVTFYARIGDTSAASIRIQFNDSLTRPEGGKCKLDGAPGQQCYDGFGIDIPGLSTTWQAFRIPFAGLTQRGFGVPGGALDTATLYEVGLAFPPAVITDFWLDDIRFYK